MATAERVRSLGRLDDAMRGDGVAFAWVGRGCPVLFTCCY